MPPLRDLLAERVRAARAAAVASTPPDGVFTALDALTVIHFTTTGRRSGLIREKWWLPFAVAGDALYLLEEAGTAASWVRNVIADPSVTVEGTAATARIVDDTDEQVRARDLCRERFARVGLVVADLVETGLVAAFDASGSGRA